jgi:hypothetical protein
MHSRCNIHNEMPMHMMSCQGVTAGAAPGRISRAPGVARREREGEEGEKRGEGKLTSRLDERQQPLTEIQPRARRGGERWKRRKLLRVKGRMRGRGWGTPRGKGHQGARAWAGVATTRARPWPGLTTRYSLSPASNRD